MLALKNDTSDFLLLLSILSSRIGPNKGKFHNFTQNYNIAKPMSMLLVRKMVKFNIFMKEDVKSRDRRVLETDGDEKGDNVGVIEIFHLLRHVVANGFIARTGIYQIW